MKRHVLILLMLTLPLGLSGCASLGRSDSRIMYATIAGAGIGAGIGAIGGGSVLPGAAAGAFVGAATAALSE